MKIKINHREEITRGKNSPFMWENDKHIKFIPNYAHFRIRHMPGNKGDRDNFIAFPTTYASKLDDNICLFSGGTIHGTVPSTGLFRPSTGLFFLDPPTGLFFFYGIS